MLAPGARRVVRRRVSAGLVPEIGWADGLHRRVRPRRGLAAPTYAMLPCPRARMASQRVSERLEHVDDPHLMTRRTLPLVGERTWRHVQGRVAVPPSLPLGIERTVSVRSGASGSAAATPRGEWQCVSHCHSGVSAPGSAPCTATRCRAYRTGAHERRVAVRTVRPTHSTLLPNPLEQLQHATHQALEVTRIASGNFEHGLVGGVGIPRLVGREREPQHVHPQGMGHDDLVHGGHAHV